MHRLPRVIDVGVVYMFIGNAETEERTGVEQHTAFGLLNLVNHPTKRNMSEGVKGSVLLNAATDIAMRSRKPAFDDIWLGLARTGLTPLAVWLPEYDIPLGPTLVEADGVPKNLDRAVRTERKVARDEGANTRHGVPNGRSGDVKQIHNMTNQTPRKSTSTTLQNVALKPAASWFF